MATKTPSRSYFIPLLLIILGFVFLLRNAGYLDLRELISRYWPLLFILVGLRILWQQGRWKEKDYSEKNGNSGIQSSPKSIENIFGDIRVEFQNEVIETFKSSNIFGDTRLNFTQASFLNPSHIRINGVFGDVDLILPPGVPVEIQVNFIGGSSRIFDEYHTGLFKNISYRSPGKRKANSTVVLEISIIFGDILITHSSQ